MAQKILMKSLCQTAFLGFLFLGLLLTSVGLSPVAEAKDKKAAKAGESAGDLFDALGGGLEAGESGLGDLKAATDQVEAKKQKSVGQPLSLHKQQRVGDGSVKVTRVFAAPKMVIKKGKCVAVPYKVTSFTAAEFPFDADRFSVCAHLEGGAGRAMRMRVMVMTGRGKIIGSSESIASFSGKRRIDHTIDFPSLEFPEAGVYRYVIEIEGKRVANMPLFEVRPKTERVVPE